MAAPGGPWRFRFAAAGGRDPEMDRFFTYALLAAAGLPVVGGALDAVTGPTNLSNSGEVPANLGYALLAPAGMLAGAGAATAVTPEADLAGGLVPYALERARLAYKAGHSNVQTPGDIERLVAKRRAIEAREQAAELEARNRLSLNRKPQARATGLRHLQAGALIGGLLGGVYALQQMDDPKARNG